ncbi:DNA repair protein RecN [Dialister micraerophilus]|uniref:DNA repair protein RecN n=1 Tax=Dialister micraerophilus UPII 345-E TaxID=910314 RepID=E4L8D9_9FIRM|nr:DNA repair protein RecN [Dialister micraerophilus]EFR42937.1 DNA repair protein RecN [Dialister micraerophilus UPII 345-E]
MLRSLHISNFAIIKDIEMELGDGVTVFTGETGSGKSILVDALSLLAGKRGSTDLIRSGEDFFCVEGIFSINKSIVSLLSEFEVNDDNEDIIISRKMNKSGKSTCTVNGFFCSVKKLEEIGKKLFRFHEQYDNTDLLNSDFCKRIIDNFSVEIKSAWNEYSKIYSDWKTTKSKIEKLNKEEQEYQRKLDVLLWETQQIEDARICLEEDSKIAQKLSILQNYERIQDGLQTVSNILSEENGIQDKLSVAEKEISRISKYDKDLDSTASELESIKFSIEEIINNIGNHLSLLDFSENELDELNQRDEVLKNLMRKFGPSLEDVLNYYEKALKKIDEIQKMFFDKESLLELLKKQNDVLSEKSKILYKLREKEGKKFCDLLVNSLKDMSIKAASMELRMIPSQEPTAIGVASMEFYFSANEGEPLKPMKDIASGGELSRISLAIEIITSNLWGKNTMIFDEIDTGISGKVAVEVASKLKMLSKNTQVLCITHLPQTASIADAHYRIEKFVENGRTLSVLKKLSHEEHLQDIAFMISGSDSSKSALDSAKEIEKVIKNSERRV